jgi:hypothetical protein
MIAGRSELTLSRIGREKKTIEKMIGIYCHHYHKSKKFLCPECSALLEYAKNRLDKCPFQERKTTCANCRIHCYKPDMREKIKDVMRFSGPRMAYRHPILALFHALDGLKKEQKGKSKSR